jgi:two-component system, sensor histidine kinase FlrB
MPVPSSNPNALSSPVPSHDAVLGAWASHALIQDTAVQLSRSYQLLEMRVEQLTQELDAESQKRQAARAENAQLAERLQTLLDLMPGGIVVLDAKGLVVECNPAAKRLLQHALVGHLWREVIRDCFAPRGDDGLEISTRDGKRLSMATSPLNAEGQLILLTDQTETRRLQHQVSRYERLSAMGKMVSALAHQIRTPLSAALLYADHLSRGALNRQQQERCAQKIQGRLQHMERQVRDMLLFVRHELPLNDLVTLDDLEHGVRAAAEVTLASCKSYCIFITPKPDVTLRCNREALISAIGNLINNAVQACDHVNIAVRFEQRVHNGMERVCISVIDDGPGMSARQLQAAKELFYTTKSQGTGLGLAVVQSVARAHGGFFSLQSAPGQGTKARIVLPHDPADLQDAQLAPTQPDAPRAFTQSLAGFEPPCVAMKEELLS